MAKTQQLSKKSLNYKDTLRIARVHFLYGLAFAASIIVYDASKLIPPDAVLSRWKYTVSFLLISTIVWYLARARKDNASLQKLLIALLVCTDILFASLLVYADRGMASPALALYFVPISTVAILLSRSALLATAALCSIAYAFTTMKYFVDFFNEGYKVQLYSTIGLYSAMFFVVALLLNAVVHRKTD
ncbi:hypothetical protein KC968_03095 [Candidatus Saccharibacteria bacterium]|nr:hypothetical protein [Candidatus Saccharibacteria bacterium]